MRVTIAPRHHAPTILVVAAIIVSSVLLVLVMGAVHGDDAPGPDDVAPAGETSPTGTATGSANPWEVGNAAALRELAELRRQMTVDPTACP